eukprot:scaffold177974_cov41-Prasinocladus_malaysianus.AAC.1
MCADGSAEALSTESTWATALDDLSTSPACESSMSSSSSSWSSMNTTSRAEGRMRGSESQHSRTSFWTRAGAEAARLGRSPRISTAWYICMGARYFWKGASRVRHSFTTSPSAYMST